MYNNEPEKLKSKNYREGQNISNKNADRNKQIEAEHERSTITHLSGWEKHKNLKTELRKQCVDVPKSEHLAQ